MTLQSFLALLGDPIDGSTSDFLYEDTFSVLAHRPPPKNLGFIDRTSSTISVTVNGHEFTINQSPQLLKSERTGGTTGAVVWSLTPLLASFLGSSTNPLAVHGILNPQSTVLELGSGVSSILALSLAVAPSTLRPARIVLSDQEYVLKIARQNLEDNLQEAGHWEKLREDTRPSFVSYRVCCTSAKKQNSRDLKRHRKPQTKSLSLASEIPHSATTVTFKPDADAPIQVDLITLDWEQDSLKHHPAFTQGLSISLVIAIDCIYNESLIPHLIQTCVDACTLGSSATTSDAPESGVGNPNDTLVLIALELRSPDVLDYFLEVFTKFFRVWRIPDNLLCKELRTAADCEDENVGSGNVVYCGVLKGPRVPSGQI